MTTAAPSTQQPLHILATTREAATALRVSPQALLAALHEGRAPLGPVAMLGRAYAWDAHEVARAAELIPPRSST